MKKVFSVLVFAVVLFRVCTVWGISVPDDPVRVAAFPLEPLNYFDPSGDAQGFNVDLIREVAAGSAWEPVFVPVSWAEGLEKLQSGEVDLMVSVMFTPERAETMDYSREKVVEVWGQVFVRSDSPVMDTLDLEGRRVGIMRRDINGRNFIGLIEALGIECELVGFDTHADIFSAVASGDLSAGVAPNHYGQRHASRFGLRGTAIQFSPQPLFFTARKGKQQKVLQDLDTHLAEWKKDKDSYYYRRLEHWLNAGRSRRHIPGWLWVVVGGTGLSSLLFFGLSWLLKYQVRLRTAELAESEERYRLLIESHSDLVVKVDPEGRFLYVSPTYCTLFGKSENELLGHVFFPLIHEEDQASTRKSFLSVFKPPYEAYMEQRAMTKDGWCWLSWLDTAVFDEQGNVESVIGVGRDITERKRLEEERLRYVEELERFNRAATGRELRMIELKKEVNSLCRELNREASYPLSFLENQSQNMGI